MPSTSLKTFLRNAHASLGKIRSAAPSSSGASSKMTFVMGNQASDLDSMVAAVVYSFFLQTLSKSPDIRFSPLINIPRQHFPLRGEAADAFSSAGVDVSLVPFEDEVDLKKLSDAKGLSVILVDHNKLADNQEFLSPHVAGIIDHHKEEGLYDSTCTHGRIVEPIGSCCSLVALRALKEAPEIITPEIATLLTSVILLDTSCMSTEVKKGTPKDQQALHQLEKKGGIKSSSYSSLYETLLKARNDISKLNSAQLLIKDTKYGTINGWTFAIAGVPLSVEGWMARDEEMITAFDAMLKDQKLDFLIAMTMYTSEEHGFSRQLVVTGKDAKASETLASSLVEAKTLELKPLPKSPKAGNGSVFCHAYQQGNIRASRKQVMPMVNDILGSSQPKAEEDCSKL
uniref:DHHA2 domain-containing protein n=1 Tax=Lotharella oceanica TaxID=641309 RepID=A0A7S2TLT5_9EUKA|mmetsp:Transcript_20128/g.37839  ORF Transcript_20128/g.37839 Transcript_20128/m.37839 type:complete len:399 (+) Transcript_20128:76-1272(+)